MLTSEELGSLPPSVAGALAARGFDTLTAVQQAVLAEGAAGHDLRVSSQTGSGKTVALGLVLARELGDQDLEGRTAALVLTPTRELASQVSEELCWLLSPLGWAIVPVTGGTAFGPEARALRRRPQLVVATPGRLRDHIERGTLDTSTVCSIVLDEADQMLDFGFREDLEAILSTLPEGRRTHLVSATFGRAVAQLAERYQQSPLPVQGTALGEANRNIDHVTLVVPHSARLDALVNVLLCDPEERTLVFARTRADTAEVAAQLQQAGFAAAGMSGDLSQAERTRRLGLFRSGAVPVLVATDVAARGIDVPDIGRVVHLHLAAEPDAYTHRSGRTGRAGRRGESIILTTPRDERTVQRLLKSLGLRAEPREVPGPEAIRSAAGERVRRQLSEGQGASDELRAMAERLLQDHEPAELVARLLERSRLEGPCAPREVRQVRPRAEPAKRASEPRAPLGPVATLQLDWGARQGADTRRLLAMVCRRTGLSSAQIGAIQIGPYSSHLEVAKHEAERAVARLSEPDAKDRKVRARITAARGPARPRGAKRPERAPHKGARPGRGAGDRAPARRGRGPARDTP